MNLNDLRKLLGAAAKGQGLIQIQLVGHGLENGEVRYKAQNALSLPPHNGKIFLPHIHLRMMGMMHLNGQLHVKLLTEGNHPPENLR